MCSSRNINNAQHNHKKTIANTKMYSGSEHPRLLHPLPKISLGISLYSLRNTAELFYTGITTLTHCGFSTETHKPTWFFTRLTNNPLWFFNGDPQTNLVFHGLTKNPGGFTRRPTNQLGFSRANQKPWWFFSETHQPIQEKIKSKAT